MLVLNINFAMTKHERGLGRAKELASLVASMGESIYTLLQLGRGITSFIRLSDTLYISVQISYVSYMCIIVYMKRQ